MSPQNEIVLLRISVYEMLALFHEYKDLTVVE